MSPSRGSIHTSLPLELRTFWYRSLHRLRVLPTPCFLQQSFHSRRKIHGSPAAQKPIVPQTFIHDYFSANNTIDRGWLSNPLIATTTILSPNHATESRQQAPTEQDLQREQSPAFSNSQSQRTPASVRCLPGTERQQELPHRRRKRLKENAKAAAESSLPLDASSRLTTAASSLPQSALFRRRLTTYLSLAKPRLSFLILLTTTTSYSLYPIPDVLSTTATAASDLLLSATPPPLSTSTLTLLYLTTGTFLSCASANTLNMLYEPRTDALMSRTRNRPLVQNLISPSSASLFAVATATSGLTLLYLGTNPTVAGLSALNILLYSAVYTPLKRLSPWNTWVGALVGAIPPLMGWAAAAGVAATTEHSSWIDLLFSADATGGWLLAALLFAWQFPHFNSLSHGIREDYKNAGLKMLAWMNPARNGRVALRYSVAMFPICAGLYAAGYVNVGFLAVSTAFNVWMTREAWRFWRTGGKGGSARGLFWASVWQLPLVLIGALVCKSGVWERLFADDGEGEEAEGLEKSKQVDNYRDRASLGQLQKRDDGVLMATDLARARSMGGMQSAPSRSLG
ncbi:MAG: hypothetical protein Q9160_008903 [Pyrenula sp. 1 TL-2023]